LERLFGDDMKKKVNDMNGKDKISIKEYFDSKIVELKNYMDTRFNAIDDSTKLAASNWNARLESMNHFRESMKDQTRQYITRVEYNGNADKISSDIRFLRECIAKNEGKASQQSVNVTMFFAIVGIVIGFLGLLLSVLRG